jgi:hypothetical protein
VPVGLAVRQKVARAQYQTQTHLPEYVALIRVETMVVKVYTFLDYSGTISKSDEKGVCVESGLRVFHEVTGVDSSRRVPA